MEFFMINNQKEDIYAFIFQANLSCSVGFVNFVRLHRCCCGYHARLECGRLLVRAPVGPNQRL
jgi:hypothetical protein